MGRVMKDSEGSCSLIMAFVRVMKVLMTCSGILPLRIQFRLP